MYITIIWILNRKPANPIEGYLARSFEYRYLANIQTYQLVSKDCDVFMIFKSTVLNTALSGKKQAPT